MYSKILVKVHFSACQYGLVSLRPQLLLTENIELIL
jgi:hypothetical protein